MVDQPTSAASEPVAKHDRRGDWEERWRGRPGDHFVWNLEAVPDRLTTLLAEGDVPEGAAIDVGCGNGIVSAHLATCRAPTVGIDIAWGAVVQARRQSQGDGPGATFLVGDAARLPLRSGSVALLFDRGCLQNLPRPQWTAYFLEAERLLMPGGVLQLFCSRAINSFPSLFSKKGLKARIRWFRGHRPGPQFASRSFIRNLTPATLAVEVLEDGPIRMPNGNVRGEIYGCFRKRTT